MMLRIDVGTGLFPAPAGPEKPHRRVCMPGEHEECLRGGEKLEPG